MVPPVNHKQTLQIRTYSGKNVFDWNVGRREKQKKTGTILSNEEKKSQFKKIHQMGVLKK